MEKREIVRDIYSKKTDKKQKRLKMIIVLLAILVVGLGIFLQFNKESDNGLIKRSLDGVWQIKASNDWSYVFSPQTSHTLTSSNFNSSVSVFMSKVDAGLTLDSIIRDRTTIFTEKGFETLEENKSEKSKDSKFTRYDFSLSTGLSPSNQKVRYLANLKDDTYTAVVIVYEDDAGLDRAMEVFKTLDRF